jgi:hypothetical protein
MDSSWYEALVIILGAALALFLILFIVLTVKLIQIANTAKRITEHAEKVADQAEHVSEFFAKTATPVAVVKLLSNVSEMLQGKEKKK